MSRTITDECVDCGKPCLGMACRFKNVIRYYCDECGNEFESDELYDDGGEMLCEDCLKARFKTVAEMESEGAYERDF